MNGKVLIVEDDQAMAVALRDGFEYEGYAVQVARDGAAGLKLATERELDLIILDVMLPKMSGFDVCSRTKKTLGLTGTYIVLLTAKGQEFDRQKGLEVGADLYMTKPFDPDALLQKARDVLGL